MMHGTISLKYLTSNSIVLNDQVRLEISAT